MEPSSSLKWGDYSWEVTRGCSMISSGCANCLSPSVVAFRTSPDRNQDLIRGLVRPTASGYRWGGRIHLAEGRLKDPFQWPSESRVIVNQHSDLFHESVPSEYIMSVFDIMANTDHTYVITTKRPARMARWFYSMEGIQAKNFCESQGYEWPLSNVWLGTSVENQASADHRVPSLIETPAEVRFVECMPLLGPVNLTDIQCPLITESEGTTDFSRTACVMCDQICDSTNQYQACDGRTFDALEEGIHWVIAGCEVALPRRLRGMNLNWVRALRDDCATHAVPFCYRQGKNEFGEFVEFPFLDGRTYCESPYDGGDWY